MTSVNLEFRPFFSFPGWEMSKSAFGFGLGLGSSISSISVDIVKLIFLPLCLILQFFPLPSSLVSLSSFGDISNFISRRRA